MALTAPASSREPATVAHGSSAPDSTSSLACYVPHSRRSRCGITVAATRDGEGGADAGLEEQMWTPGERQALSAS
jgi:hypothetical protein